MQKINKNSCNIADNHNNFFKQIRNKNTNFKFKFKPLVLENFYEYNNRSNSSINNKDLLQESNQKNYNDYFIEDENLNKALQEAKCSINELKVKLNILKSENYNMSKNINILQSSNNDLNNKLFILNEQSLNINNLSDKEPNQLFSIYDNDCYLKKNFGFEYLNKKDKNKQKKLYLSQAQKK